jgi:hypothetical protein
MYKIIGADGKEYGPIPAEQLRQWIAEGRVNAQTRVMPEGATEWKVLADFPEFIPTMPGTPAGPPPLTAMPGGGGASLGQVNGPAIGLIITAILGILLQIVGLVWRIVGTSLMASQQDIPPFLAALSGGLGIAMGIVGILIGVVIMIGALKMKKLEGHGFAMAASVLAMIPCVSPCCLLGLPIGIWAVVVLSKPEIKSSFH